MVKRVRGLFQADNDFLTFYVYSIYKPYKSGDNRMSINKPELELFVQRVIEDFPQEGGYPSNIIDHVFLAIEKNALYHRRYEQLVAAEKRGVKAVHPWIAKLVKKYANMETELEAVPAKLSSLIQTYTELK